MVLSITKCSLCYLFHAKTFEGIHQAFFICLFTLILNPNLQHVLGSIIFLLRNKVVQLIWFKSKLLSESPPGITTNLVKVICQYFHFSRCDWSSLFSFWHIILF